MHQIAFGRPAIKAHSARSDILAVFWEGKGKGGGREGKGTTQRKREEGKGAG